MINWVENVRMCASGWQQKKVENVCRTLPKQVVEWRKEDVCVKVPQNSCKTVSRTSPTKVIPVIRVSNGEGGWTKDTLPLSPVHLCCLPWFN